MTSFFPSRGCVYTFSQSGASPKGFYALQPALTGADGSPILLTGIAIEEKDIVAAKVTMSGYKVLFSFGPDFGNAVISALVLLGSPDAGAGQGLGAAINYFETNRVSKNQTPITASLPGNVAYMIYLTSLAVGDPDPKYNVLPIRFTGIVPSLPTT